MTTTLATYSFLPWLRQGLANQISAADLDTNVKVRATIPVALTLSGEGAADRTVTRDVQLFGPGDIVGIDSRAIIRTEPRNWITNFEPNYIPAIEFYDEDFPWRYTPAAPNGDRLRPWIALVVLKAGEFEQGTNVKDRPLPFIKVPNPAVFPPAEQLWAWAHVHVNRELDAGITSTNMDVVLGKLQNTLNENRDLAYSRLICPRKLEANSAYDAFLLPVFESGRLAGLGLNPNQAPYATCSAWAPYPPCPEPDCPSRPEPDCYPVYYRWHFRTGTVGDFEYLVRLLQPRTVDQRVGTRDMDVQKPGVNLPGITDPALGGILKLGGALKVPKSNPYPDDQWAQPYPDPFQKALAQFINLGADYTKQNAAEVNRQSTLGPTIENDPDPMITPPLYGRWHALTERLFDDSNPTPLPGRPPVEPPPPNANWVHELNLDPRFRVAAGFGTKVVQANQENYMNAAWEQIGDVLEANRRIRLAQLAKEIAGVWYERHLRPLHAVDAAKAYALAAPLHKRVLDRGLTLHHRMVGSFVTPANVSIALRRITRPRGRLMRRLGLSAIGQPLRLLTRIDNHQISAAPPKLAPTGVATMTAVSRALLAGNLPANLRTWLQQYPDLTLPPAVLDSFANRATFVLTRPNVVMRRSPDVAQAPAAANIPIVPITVPPAPITVPTTSGQSNRTALRFKDALREVYQLFAASADAAARPARQSLNVLGAAKTLLDSINPAVTIPARLAKTIFLPPHIRDQQTEPFVEAMAYPEFDLPMYEPLVKISSELFLPNINLIEQNSITLLQTNQKFIEAYMVGLNHEFARELLWREYPTDQRGSYFRQFWAVDSYLHTEDLDDDLLKEKLRDIPPLHRWIKTSKLGSHDHRELVSGAREEEVVLVIRGELLKKYPNAVIYAQRARWQLKPDKSIDNTKERDLVDLEEAELANPLRDIIKTPLYEAKVAPDIYFFGFDLTVPVAKGGTGENPGDDPGWFFVIKERPGEPRFGLDINRSGALNVWNDLAWNDVLPNAAPGAYIQVNRALSHGLTNPAGNVEQYVEDTNVQWGGATSADFAYILYQAPVLMAVHAAEMLKTLGDDGNLDESHPKASPGA